MARTTPTQLHPSVCDSLHPSLNRGVSGGGALIYVSDLSQVHHVANTIFTENNVSLFVDPDNGDFRLLPGSPMIDAGDPDTPYLPEVDIIGTPRMLGASVDIGAYELDDASDPGGILFIEQEGTGSGIITSNPAGIDCGDDCFNGFVLNTEVTLTATPHSGSIFSGWSGDPDCADGVFIMDGNNGSCTATFTAVNTLRVSKTGAGMA